MVLTGTCRCKRLIVEKVGSLVALQVWDRQANFKADYNVQTIALDAIVYASNPRKWKAAVTHGGERMLMRKKDRRDMMVIYWGKKETTWN